MSMKSYFTVRNFKNDILLLETLAFCLFVCFPSGLHFVCWLIVGKLFNVTVDFLLLLNQNLHRHQRYKLRRLS